MWIAALSCALSSGCIGEDDDGYAEEEALATAMDAVSTTYFGPTIASSIDISLPDNRMATYSYDDRSVFSIEYEIDPGQGLVRYFRSFDPLKGLENGRSPVLPNAVYWAMASGGPSRPDGALVLLSINGGHWLLHLDHAANFANAILVTPLLEQPDDEYIIVSDFDITDGASYFAVTAKPEGDEALEARVVRVEGTQVETHVLPYTPALTNKGFRLAFDHYLSFPQVAVALIGDTYHAVCHNGSSYYGCANGSLPTPAGGDPDDWDDLSLWGLKLLAHWKGGTQTDEIHLRGYVLHDPIETYPPAGDWGDFYSVSMRHNIGLSLAYPAVLFTLGSHSQNPTELRGYHIPLFP